jgi:hypothetical protein
LILDTDSIQIEKNGYVKLIGQSNSYKIDTQYKGKLKKLNLDKYKLSFTSKFVDLVKTEFINKNDCRPKYASWKRDNDNMTNIYFVNDIIGYIEKSSKNYEILSEASIDYFIELRTNEIELVTFQLVKLDTNDESIQIIENKEIVINDGDVYAFNIANNTDQILYYNILCIDENNEIKVRVPNRKEKASELKIFPGQQITLMDNKFPVNNLLQKEYFKLIFSDKAFDMNLTLYYLYNLELCPTESKQFIGTQTIVIKP